MSGRAIRRSGPGRHAGRGGPRRWLVLLAAVAGLALGAAPADAEILWQTRISGNGAYGIVHFGAVGGRRYVQIYVHDISPDHRCAEIWADFATVGIAGQHRHEDSARAIICGHGRKGWSRRHYVPHVNELGRVTGIRWVDACWRTRNARDCRNELADNNGYIRRGRYEDLRVRPSR